MPEQPTVVEGQVGDALAVFKDVSFLFEPGTRYVYSAYNFVLLSAAIEGASGRDFLSYVHERTAAPFGLLRTTPDRRTAPMPGRVTTYVAGWGGTPMPAPPIDVSNKWAAGGFVSAPSDMVRLGSRSFAVDGRELRVAHHGGTANGAMSFFFILPEVDLVVALQVNLLFEPFSSFANTAYAVAGSFLAADGGSSSR